MQGIDVEFSTQNVKGMCITIFESFMLISSSKI